MPLEIFGIAFIAVAVLLVSAVPGYIFIKSKMMSEEAISAFTKLLLYIASSCLVIFAFKSATFSVEKLIDLGIFALLSLLLNGIMLGGAFLVLKKRYKDTVYRIITIATTFTNCTFFGIPIIEALLPEQASEIIIYASVYALVMNIFGWTVASAIISGDARYISLKKILINPTMICTVIAFLLFLTQLPIHPEFENLISITGKMSTPLSMIIMGMRLATMKFSSLFVNPRVYITVAVKQIVMPLATFALVYFLPVNPEIKAVLFIVAACPVASAVLNYSELIGEGQKEAANMVLLGTILSLITLPITMMLLPLLGV